MTHLINHALGLISVGAADTGRWWFTTLWRSVPGTLLLYLALLAHPILGYIALYRRRTLRMPAAEVVQLAFAVCIPLLLAGHVVGTRLAHTLFGREDTYTALVYGFWHVRPWIGVKQSALLVIAWTHGCIGLHYWLRLRSWYRPLVALAYATALLLPVLALGGFAQMGREVTAWDVPATVARREAALRAVSLPPDALASLWTIELTIYAMFIAAPLGVLGARALRDIRARRGSFRVRYPDGRIVTVPAGFSILEASRFANVPHVSVCGGRGRCSTCRVRIDQGAEQLPPPTDAEARVLRRVSAPQGIRLACQTRPRGDCAVAPLITPVGTPETALEAAAATAGREQEIAVLFADLRSFTSVAERKLPYDVVYLLNRYFEAVGGAVRDAGGIANQFTGDGVMALFGIDATPVEGCRAALRGAAAMIASVEALSRALTAELPAPLRLGIGIHVGPAVVGRMGFAEAAYLTAVGDTVHVAARLEELTKTYGSELVISEDVATRAGVDVRAYPREELTLRNRSRPLAIRVIADARRLAAQLAPVPARA